MKKPNRRNGNDSSTFTRKSWHYFVLFLVLLTAFAVFIYPRSLVWDIKIAQKQAVARKKARFLYDVGNTNAPKHW